MKILLSDKQYKVNLHAHTNVSDGARSPLELKAYYKAHGYHAVAFTDHEILVPHEDLTDGEFIALHGYEYGIRCGTGALRAYYHLNLLARTPHIRTHILFRPSAVEGNALSYVPTVEYRGGFAESAYSVEFVNRLIREAHREGYLVQYNHPNHSNQHYPQYAGLEGLDLLEVFNYSCTVRGRAERDDRVFDDLLSLGKRPIPTGNDDCHAAFPEDDSRFDCGGAYNMVAADAFTYEGIMEAIAGGRTYATEAPRFLSIVSDGTRVTVRCSALSYLRAEGAGKCGETVRACGGGQGITEFSFVPTGEWQYFRLIAEDKNGRRAYSRAYDIGEI